MPRKARKRGPKGTPWYRSFTDTWYMPKVDGSKAKPILDADGYPVKGRENKEKAFALWHETVERDRAPTKGLDNPLSLIFEEFLDYTHRHREKDTYDEYRRTLQSFKDKWPNVTVNDLSVRHVEAWFDDHPTWSDTTKHIYVTTVLAALNWAAKPTVKLIPFNPLRGMERPRKRSRGGSAKVSDEAHKALFARVPWDFQQILLVLRHTGTRPGNICRVTAKNFNAEAGVWVFDEHNTDAGSSVHKSYKKTGRALIVPLTPTVVTLCNELVKKYPEGRLFRTRRGRPWRPGYIIKRFILWRQKLVEEGVEMPDTIFAYCYRHQLGTYLLEQGESDTLVAAVLGHKGTKVLHEHYSGVTARNKPVRDVLVRNVTALPEELSVSGGTGGKPEPLADAGSAADQATQEGAEPGAPSPG